MSADEKPRMKARLDQETANAVESALGALAVLINASGVQLPRTRVDILGELEELPSRERVATLLMPFMMTSVGDPRAECPVDAGGVKAAMRGLGYCASMLRYDTASEAESAMCETFRADFVAGFEHGRKMHR